MSQLFVDDVVSKEGTNSVGFSKGVNVSASSTITGNLNVSGVLTYEDVTNVDSVGIVTARGGIKLGAAGIGGTFNANGDTTLAGVVTAISFSGDGSALTGVANTDNVNTAGLNVIGVATVGGDASVAGFTTFSANVTLSRAAGPTLELVTNANTANSSLHLSEGTAGSTTNGGAVIYSGANNKLSICCGTTLTTERIGIARDSGDVTIGTGVTISSAGICTITTGTDLNGYKVEEGSYDTNALNGEFDFELENGHIQTHTGSTAGTYFPDFRVSSSQSLSSVMDVGDVVSATLIVTASNTSHYCTAGIKIDNSTSNVTVEWIGSAAPSAGKGAGYDIYAFTIQKTAATPAYLVIVNATDAG